MEGYLQQHRFPCMFLLDNLRLEQKVLQNSFYQFRTFPPHNPQLLHKQ